MKAFFINVFFYSIYDYIMDYRSLNQCPPGKPVTWPTVANALFIMKYENLLRLTWKNADSHMRVFSKASSFAVGKYFIIGILFPNWNHCLWYTSYKGLIFCFFTQTLKKSYCKSYVYQLPLPIVLWFQWILSNAQLLRKKIRTFPITNWYRGDNFLFHLPITTLTNLLHVLPGTCTMPSYQAHL